MTLSPEALALFVKYAADAGNWSGTPLVGGNVAQTMVNNGYLTAAKKAGLLTTSKWEGDVWISFTAAGIALAASNGIIIHA